MYHSQQYVRKCIAVLTSHALEAANTHRDSDQQHGHHLVITWSVYFAFPFFAFLLAGVSLDPACSSNKAYRANIEAE